jgi:signal peptidase I
VAGCGQGSFNSGDRVLVNKYIYDSGLRDPQRNDVVVFRCPYRDRYFDRRINQENDVGLLDNFIKRLLGLAGETLAIFFGQIFVTTDLVYPRDLDGDLLSLSPDGADPLDLWRKEYMYQGAQRPRDLFKFGKLDLGPPGRTWKGFTIIRKSPDTMLAMRRPVYDNDHQAKDLIQARFPARWQPAGASSWSADTDKSFRHDGKSVAAPEWLRYHNILRPRDWSEGAARTHKPQLITDFSGYNSYESETHDGRDIGGNWVGDLMLEFELTVDRAEGEFRVELSRGVDRFQARWNLSTGKCTLVRLQDGSKDKDGKELATADTAIKSPGTYQVRFANFDERLTVWVDRRLPFGDGQVYPRAWSYDKDKGAFVNTGPTKNDLEPASIGSRGAAVRVQHLQLWRNTYYTLDTKKSDARLPDFKDPVRDAERFWSDPDQWDPLRKLDVLTMYVQKGHYLCLGDNSPESFDSRGWGTVPQRLMLGRALVVYYPFNRAGLIK